MWWKYLCCIHALMCGGACMCAGAHEYICTCICWLQLIPGVFFDGSSPYILRQGLSFEPRAQWVLSSLASYPVCSEESHDSASCTLVLQAGHSTHSSTYRDAGGLNSSPKAWVESTLPAEQSFQPFKSYGFKKDNKF